MAYDAEQWAIGAPDGGVFAHAELPFARVRESPQAVHDVRHALQTWHFARIVLAVSASPLRDAGGGFAGMVTIIRDVTVQWQQAHFETMRGNLLAATSALSTAAFTVASVQQLIETGCQAFDRVLGVRARLG